LTAIGSESRINLPARREQLRNAPRRAALAGLALSRRAIVPPPSPRSRRRGSRGRPLSQAAPVGV
jgi:hypothetical protein